MILVGIAIGNINNGRLVEGLPASWSKELRAIALAIIFLRSGLELDLRVSYISPHLFAHVCNPQGPLLRIQHALILSALSLVLPRVLHAAACSCCTH